MHIPGDPYLLALTRDTQDPGASLSETQASSELTAARVAILSAMQRLDVINPEHEATAAFLSCMQPSDMFGSRPVVGASLV